MKAKIALTLVLVLILLASIAFAKTVEPKWKEFGPLAGKTIHATISDYNAETKTFTVTLYEYDRYDPEDTEGIAIGDSLLAGGYLYKINGLDQLDDTTVFLCDGGEEIYFGESYDDDDNDLIARSTMDDRIFMHVVTVLHLPVAEGIVFEDNSDPEKMEMDIIKGLDAILNVQAAKNEYSNGLNYYATKISINDNLEIEKIHQDFDVAQ